MDRTDGTADAYLSSSVFKKYFIANVFVNQFWTRLPRPYQVYVIHARHVDTYKYIYVAVVPSYLALTCQQYFTPICKSHCVFLLSLLSFFLSLSLSLFFCFSATASNRQQLRHCLLFCAFLFFSVFSFVVLLLGPLSADICSRHSSVITSVVVAHLPALVSSVVCYAVFRKLKWRQRVCVCVCVCWGGELSAMWGLPCRTCILIFIEQIEQPNEILIVCHACGFCGLSPDVWQFITVCAV